LRTQKTTAADSASCDAGLEQKRRQLNEAIENDWQNFVGTIQVYVKKFGLARESAEIKTLAQEVLHETIITAHQIADKYELERPARSWLWGIAIKHMQRRQRSKNIEQRHITPIAEMPEVRQAKQQLDSKSLSEDEMFAILYQDNTQSNPLSQLTLNELLALVSPSDQEILTLAFVQDLRGKVLAAELGISEGAANTRLSRVLGRLRDAYKQNQQQLAEEI
jgi:RNA polymerase sigma factor (sigma-70 family)